MSDKEYAEQQLSKLLTRINQAAQTADRDPKDICLIGAAKQQSHSRIAAFVNAGLKDLGHNYLQEALLNQTHTAERDDLNWHFIGHIQSNKTTTIANHFSWVHSVDRFKIARRLSEQRESKTVLNILLQVDIDNEPSKGGVAIDQAVDLCGQISQLENLKLRGLMVLPKARSNAAEQSKPFAQTRELLEHCNQHHGLAMDTLSMGMSNDLEAAIKEGSTMIRVGTDLFGSRT